jgi:hypothetical protein
MVTKNSVELKPASAAFPLTPALSPGEWENLRRFFRMSEVSVCRPHI